jgi:hypothetical protein
MWMTGRVPEGGLRAVMRWLDPATAPPAYDALTERLGAALTATSHDASAAYSLIRSTRRMRCSPRPSTRSTLT